MNPLLLGFFCVVFSVRDSLSGFISTPGIQRRRQSESCTFQWTTTGPVTNFRVYNETLGIARDLSASASYTFDNNTGVINLTISNIRMWDAGNYSASVTKGTTNEINSGALLFVYGYSYNFVSQTAGPNPPTEGDAVELSCNVQLTSVPAAYRPPLYYFWDIQDVGELRNISNGPALLWNGDLLTGYSIKNNGRTLAIASAQYQDGRGILCYGKEEVWDGSSSAWLYLPLLYRPYALRRNPASGKVNPALYEYVSMSFIFKANPSITSMTSWSFISADGHSQDLPSDAESSPFSSNMYLRFNFTSVGYYGNYSLSATNDIGSTTEIFQVLPQAENNGRTCAVTSAQYEDAKGFSSTTLSNAENNGRTFAVTSAQYEDAKGFSSTTQSNAENNGPTLPVTSAKYKDAKGFSSTTQSNEMKDSLDVNALRVAVIVLAILLGICCLALVGVSIAFCAWKCHGNGRIKITPAEMPVIPDDHTYQEVLNRSCAIYDNRAENEDTRDKSKHNKRLIPAESSKETETYEMPVIPDDHTYQAVLNRSCAIYDNRAENEDARDESKGNSSLYS